MPSSSFSNYYFRFQFDRVFNEDDDNQTVYKDRCFDVIESALDGFNSTIFAYGQTASGKTHTMDAVIEEGMLHISDAIRQDLKHKNFNVRVSYMEIYNEKVTDLLGPEPDKELKVQEDSDGTVNIACRLVIGLSRCTAKCFISAEARKLALHYLLNDYCFVIINALFDAKRD